jgi:predicted PurR-regulated permease PerM
VAFWGWLWGIIGALLAVPMLVILKVISHHVEGMEAYGRFLAAREIYPTEEAEREAEAA